LELTVKPRLNHPFLMPILQPNLRHPINFYANQSRINKSVGAGMPAKSSAAQSVQSRIVKTMFAGKSPALPPKKRPFSTVLFSVVFFKIFLCLFHGQYLQNPLK